MRVLPVPALRDNYAYLVIDDRRRRALVVDPSEAAPVEEALRREGLTLSGILNTHHHWDHVGGNDALVARHRCPVWGGFDDAPRIPSCTERITDETERTVDGFSFRAMHVPGHTRGAVTYLIEDAAFTGDTLFVLGCGRLFEGTAEEMFRSLRRLVALPPETRIYCGHEYALSNLAFARTVVPAKNLHDYGLELEARARRGESLVPAQLSDEINANPFLRAADLDEFRRLRQAKDRFRV
jgi:hydroxyacylglutathione hydrolase